MNASLEKVSKQVTGFSIALSILLIMFGVLAILLPIATSLGVVLVVAWLLMISGVVQFVHAFRCVGVGHTLWKLAVAVIYFLAGLYFRLNLGQGLAALTLVLAMFLVAEGLVDIVGYFRTRKSGVSGWLLLDGVISLILGAMIWNHWPSGSLWVVGTLVGINMMMTGTTRLMLTMAIRRATKLVGEAVKAGQRNDLAA